MARNKYNNVKVRIDGTVFDSKKEGKIYLLLKDLERRGKITGLELHPKWELIPAITERYVKHLMTKDKMCERVLQKAITYTADFAFFHNGAKIVVDVKPSSRFALPKDFVLKEKMMRYFHGIEIKKIYSFKDIVQFE